MDRSRQFRRVSTEDQDATKQIGDLDRFDRDNGYQADGHYQADGKSAFHEKHLPLLLQAVEDIEAGQYEVLTFWALDRAWRSESGEILNLFERIWQAKGRVEFVMDSYLNDLRGSAHRRREDFSRALDRAFEESARKAQRSKMDIESKRARGSVHGRPAWGYQVECLTCGHVTVGKFRCPHKDNKRFVPTAEGRKFVPAVFQWIIEGKTAREIAQMLDRAGVLTPTGGKKWNEGFISNRVIKNPIYYGQRVNGGNLETEGLVAWGTWQEANTALSSRARPGRSTVKRDKVLCMAACWSCYGVEREGCKNGVSALYRVFVGRSMKPYLRCAGSGPQRKGCGARMIPAEDFEAKVLARYESNPLPHHLRTFIPGRNIAEEIAGLNKQIAQAATSGDYATVGRLGAQAEALKDADDVRPRYDRQPTGQTEGEHFRSLDREAQRARIAEDRILAHRTPEGQIIIGQHDAETGAVYRWVTPGEDVDTANVSEVLRNL